MANILYRGSAVPSAYATANAGGAGANRALTNLEIDQNFFALDDLKFNKAGGTISGATTFSSNVTISGNLTIDGTTTTINSTTLNVDDINVVLGDVATPTNATANGGGITLKGASDKTFNWYSASAAWTSSEHLALAAGKSLYISGATSGTATITVPAAAGTPTLTLPTSTGTIALTSDIGNGSITVNSSGPLNGSGSFTLNQSGGATITIGHNDSGVGAGTYNNVTVDAKGHVTGGSNTAYLTGESDTLGTVTGRGASTSTNITLSGGVLTLSNGSSNTITTGADTNLFINTRNSSTVGTGAVQIRTGDSSIGGAGGISIYSGQSQSASGGSVSIQGGNVNLATSTGGYVLIRGGTAIGGATTAGTGGTVYIGGGFAYAASGTKTGGSVYIDGGEPINGGTNTNGSVYIGTSGSGMNNLATASVNIGKSTITTTVNGTVKLPNVGTSGFVKLGAGGQLSADTNTYLTAESDTLGTVTARGSSTSTASTFSGGLTATGITVSKSGTESTITFPAQTNDPGYIKHYESNNTSVMYFSVSDDAGATDYFSFGNTSSGYVEGFRITASGVVNVGTWQASSISTSYTDAKITSISATGPINRDSSTGAVTISHANSGVTAGTYNNVTVNATGHVTGGSNTAYLTGESDTLSTVTGRGSSTSTAVTFSGNMSFGTGFTTLTLKDGNGGTGANNTKATVRVGEATASAVTAYAAGYSSGGIFMEVQNGDVGGLYVGTDACTVWNAGDSGYLFRVVEEDTWQAISPSQTATDPGYAPTADTATKLALTTAGDLKISGSFTAAGNVTAYSDARLKENITKIDDALDKVNQLNGYTYDRIDLKGARQTGVIAQEVLKVLPEAVNGNDEDKYTVAYGNMVGLLIEAIKELNAKVEDLQNQLANK